MHNPQHRCTLAEQSKLGLLVERRAATLEGKLEEMLEVQPGAGMVLVELELVELGLVELEAMQEGLGQVAVPLAELEATQEVRLVAGKRQVEYCPQALAPVHLEFVAL